MTASSTSNSGDSYRPFTGGNSLVLQGQHRADDHRRVRLGPANVLRSTVFLPVAGDEAAIRFGANDTIANGFTAGEYPGPGNRNIVTDGHVASSA